MMARHSDQIGSPDKREARNSQSEGIHNEDQAQSTQDQVPVKQNVNSVEMATGNYLALNTVKHQPFESVAS